MVFKISLIVGGLLLIAGLIWLGFGGPRGRLARRSLGLTTLLAPFIALVVLLEIGAPSHHGALLSVTAVEAFFALSPWLLGWFFACFIAYVVSKIAREPNA